MSLSVFWVSGGDAGLTEPVVEDTTQQDILVDDFESDPAGQPPSGWKFITSDREVMNISEALEPGERFEVREEKGNHFIRSHTEGEALRFTVQNGKQIDWSIGTHPRIAWRWRAIKLPDGASEKGPNDVGGAVYVTFGTDWIGRPKSIKYTYSSSLPVGTVVSQGPLRIIVVDSAREPRTGEWKTVMRDVRSDYRQVFGGAPPIAPSPSRSGTIPTRPRPPRPSISTTSASSSPTAVRNSRRSCPTLVADARSQRLIPNTNL